MLNTRSVTGSTHPYGSLVKGACVMSFESIHDSPASHERIGFSMAMKNIQPLDVIPMLGSFPVSPTSLKVNSISIGATPTEAPVPSVTKIRWSVTVTSGSSFSTSSAPKHPDRERVATKKQSIRALARMAWPNRPLHLCYAFEDSKQLTFFQVKK